MGTLLRGVRELQRAREGWEERGWRSSLSPPPVFLSSPVTLRGVLSYSSWLSWIFISRNIFGHNFRFNRNDRKLLSSDVFIGRNQKNENPLEKVFSFEKNKVEISGNFYDTSILDFLPFKSFAKFSSFPKKKALFPLRSSIVPFHHLPSLTTSSTCSVPSLISFLSFPLPLSLLPFLPISYISVSLSRAPFPLVH